MNENSALTLEQKARVEACQEARKILLTTRAFGPPTSTVDAIDIYNIAEYILTGNDPWAPMNLPVSEQQAEPAKDETAEPSDRREES